jgi:[ribosomal protein S5]-alanine N-acetyltransferase
MDAESFPVLQTDRLILRMAQPSDAEALFNLYADPEVTRYYNSEPFTDIDQARSVIERRDERFQHEFGIRWAICFRDEDVLIGSAGLQPWHHAWHFAELGYDLAREHWGKGIMVEALTAILKHGYGAMRLNRVEAEVMPANRQSLRVLHKLGFSREGLLRERGFWKGEYHDLVILSLLASEFYGVTE